MFGPTSDGHRFQCIASLLISKQGGLIQCRCLHIHRLFTGSIQKVWNEILISDYKYINPHNTLMLLFAKRENKSKLLIRNWLNGDKRM